MAFTSTAQRYESFVEKKRLVADLNAALQLLSWDQEIYMPNGAAGIRARQVGALSELRHEIVLEHVYPLAKALAEADGLTEHQRLNVNQSLAELTRVVRLPKAFVAEQAAHTSRSQMAWERAKAKSDFSLFEAELTKTYELKRQEAEYYGYTGEAYDALLDTYDPGLTSAFLVPLFTRMRSQLQSLINELRNAPQPPTAFLNQRISKDSQWNFGLGVLKYMGFDFDRGRQDISTHPFTTGTSPDDVRITTHINEYNIAQMLYGTIHEGGHALYEQGLPAEHYGLPACEACSLSIHESQSRIWENNIGRSLPFWKFHFEGFAQLFPDRLRNLQPEDVFRAVNVVEPSLIRIMADELTYHFHIMIRFELERALISRELAVKDLPAAWNEKYAEYLGITPSADSEGVLQDIHWSIGAIGYFPTYSLGSFYAAQFYAHALNQNPALEDQFKSGHTGWFVNWLKQEVYSRGRLYSSNDLCRLITGEDLTVDYFLRYIRNKMEQVYAITLVV
jgi:carboxypeptidase Taq